MFGWRIEPKIDRRKDFLEGPLCSNKSLCVRKRTIPQSRPPGTPECDRSNRSSFLPVYVLSTLENEICRWGMTALRSSSHSIKDIRREVRHSVVLSVEKNAVPRSGKWKSN